MREVVWAWSSISSMLWWSSRNIQPEFSRRPMSSCQPLWLCKYLGSSFRVLIKLVFRQNQQCIFIRQFPLILLSSFIVTGCESTLARKWKIVVAKNQFIHLHCRVSADGCASFKFLGQAEHGLIGPACYMPDQAAKLLVALNTRKKTPCEAVMWGPVCASYDCYITRRLNHDNCLWRVAAKVQCWR